MYNNIQHMQFAHYFVHQGSIIIIFNKTRYCTMQRYNEGRLESRIWDNKKIFHSSSIRASYGVSFVISNFASSSWPVLGATVKPVWNDHLYNKI